MHSGRQVDAEEMVCALNAILQLSDWQQQLIYSLLDRLQEKKAGGEEDVKRRQGRGRKGRKA